MSDLQSLLPQGKMEVERAEAVVALGYPAVAPVLPSLMVWLKDTNWPVSDVIIPFMTTIGLPLVPFIREVLGTDDGPWKRNVLLHLVKGSPDIFEAVKTEVRQMATGPAQDEDEEIVQEAAQEVLNHFGGWTANAISTAP